MRLSRKERRPAGVHHSPSLAQEQWRDWIPLFPPLPELVRHALEILPEALEKVWPLNRAHRKSLPEDIGELSRILTCERGNLRQPYWTHPRFISAYLYYFLPWNIIRISRLLSGLPTLQINGVPNPLVVDAGSGPLSMPIALWLARDNLRPLPITVLAVDTARRPMELGQRLFNTLAEKLQLRAWQIILAQKPLSALPQAVASLKNDYTPFLITAANALNECAHEGRRTRQALHERSDAADDAGSVPQYESFLGDLLESWAALFDYSAKSPHMLFVEPGTRLGGTTIMRLRQIALEHAMAALAPCPHDQACPLLTTSRRGHASLSSGWCHFVFDTKGAPAWLAELSLQAGLEKRSLSLSPLLLRPGTEKRPHNRDNFSARVISAPFSIPQYAGKARYACCFAGKCPMANAGDVPSGALVQASLPEHADRDGKTGAAFIAPPKKHMFRKKQAKS